MGSLSKLGQLHPCPARSGDLPPLCPSPKLVIEDDIAPINGPECHSSRQRPARINNHFQRENRDMPKLGTAVSVTLASAPPTMPPTTWPAARNPCRKHCRKSPDADCSRQPNQKARFRAGAKQMPAPREVSTRPKIGHPRALLCNRNHDHGRRANCQPDQIWQATPDAV